jgi:DNA-binding transcriptional MocR family regulator
MVHLPQRTSLVAQTVKILREAIESGQWPQYLPGEFELTRLLHVSRVTLRAALAELERRKLIRGGQGRRREVIRKRRSQTPGSARKSVVLLSPVPLHQLPASTVFWMDKLREHLDSAGWAEDLPSRCRLGRKRTRAPESTTDHANLRSRRNAGPRSLACTQLLHRALNAGLCEAGAKSSSS